MYSRTQEKSKCCGCGACASVCPKKSIEMKSDEEGFRYPVIDAVSCINCGLCERVCLFEKKKEISVGGAVVGAKALDESIRRESSSGGIFSVIAQHILAEGGSVFGATMSSDCKSVRHIMIESEQDLWKLRGSKYLQSDINDSYFIAREKLLAGRKVVFSGTPCQVAGLKAFLRREYDNLLTVEVICHGVPSPLLWNKYILYKEGTSEGKIVSVNFRAKNRGWKNFGLVEKQSDGKTVFSDLNKNTYLRFFLNNFCLRPSCFECTTRCVADIILGDFWGIDELIPDKDDDKGTSLVVLNSEKGTSFWKLLNNEIESFPVRFEDAIKYNPAMISSASPSAYRDEFFVDLKNSSFEEVKRKYEKIIKRKQSKIKTQEAVYYLKHGIIKLLGILDLRR